MNPISARSRRPAWVLTSMLSTSCRASSGASTGVLPRFTTVGTTPDLSSGLDGLVGPLPTHAPAPLPEGARFETLTYTNAAGSRVYKLYIPSGYSGQPGPLVVMLHGYTQSPDDFAAGTKMNALAEEQIFLVAYPGRPRQPITASAGTGSSQAINSATRENLRSSPASRRSGHCPIKGRSGSAYSGEPRTG